MIKINAKTLTPLDILQKYWKHNTFCLQQEDFIHAVPGKR
jgi:hypothetical protein